MKILQVSDFFDARTGNPLAVFVKSLPEKGNEVIVFSSDIAEKPGELDDSGLTAKIIRFKGMRIGKKAFFPGLILRLFFEKNIDIVHAHVLGFFSLFVCALLKPVKKYAFVVTPDFDVRNPAAIFPKTIIDFYLMNFPLHQADLVLPFTELEKKELNSRFFVPMEKMKVLPIGIDIEMFQKKKQRDYRKELELEKKFVLFSACFLYPKKNIEMVLDALETLPQEIVFLHAGGFLDREYKKKLDSIIEANNLKERVFFLGNKTVEEMPDAYRSADVFVQTGFNESFGIPVIEAMAAGLPLLATRIAVAAETIKDGENGFFIEDVKSLSMAVLKLWKNNELKKKISKANLKKANGFYWGGIIKKLLECYSGLLEKKG